MALIKKSKLPAREVEICLRVRQIREAQRLNQPKFAQLVGTSRASLSNHEYALAPLRYELASRICSEFDINQRWLATGEGPMRPCLKIPTQQTATIPERTLYSLAYDNFLRNGVDEWWQEVAKRSPDSPTLGNRRQIWPAEDHPQILQMVRAELVAAQNLMRQAEMVESLSKRQALLDEAGVKVAAALDQVGAVERSLSPEVKAFFEGRRAERQTTSLTDEKVILDKSGTDDSVGGMVSVPTWPRLRKLIAEQTSDRGAKAALAKELGVSRQVLTNWLVDRKQGAPNAETTLKLLAMFWRPVKK